VGKDAGLALGDDDLQKKFLDRKAVDSLALYPDR
jgi:hypothetical protein